MSHSWHNFFFGALEPGGSVSIDKPPVDLWLQVASVKALGYSTTSLLLPEALFGTGGGAAAVPRGAAHLERPRGPRGGARAGAAADRGDHLAQRHDGRGDDGADRARAAVRGAGDAVGQQRLAAGRRGRAGAGLRREADGVAGGAPGPGAVRRLRAARARGGGAPCSCWPAGRCTSPSRWRGCWGRSPIPAHERPFAVGSSNGSAWNAALVFNGVDRLEGKPTPGQSTTTADPPGTPPPSAYARLSQSQREQEIPIRPPSAARLLDRAGPLSGDKLGLLVLAALLLGLPALACELLERRRGADDPAADPSPADERRRLWGLGGAGAVDGAGGGPLQPDGPPASALHREHHARRGGNARDRPRLGLRAAHARCAWGRSRCA